MSLVDPAEFVRVMHPVVHRASGIVRALEGRVRNTPKLDESTDVKQALTEADVASQDAIVEAMLVHFPGVALEAEEDTESARRFPKTGPVRVVCDPIDGTLNAFLRGKGPYSILVGLEREGRYEAALVALPREGLLLHAVRGQGAWLTRAGGAARPLRPPEPGRRVLLSHSVPAGVRAEIESRGWETVIASGGAIAVAPTLRGARGGLRISASPGGVSIRGRIGLLVAREAGMCAVGKDGAPFPDDLTTVASCLVVAANEEDAGILARAVAAHPAA